MKGSLAFQSMTLMSEVWALDTVNIFALLGLARASQIRIDLSTEQEAKTLASFGDQTISSTEAVWPWYGVSLMDQEAESEEGFQM